MSVILNWAGGGYYKAIHGDAGQLLVFWVQFESLNLCAFGLHLGFCQLLLKYLENFILN